eukprot:scaffold60652_cov20-Tisochrysis_lutea.AAC.2
MIALCKKTRVHSGTCQAQYLGTLFNPSSGQTASRKTELNATDGASALCNRQSNGSCKICLPPLKALFRFSSPSPDVLPFPTALLAATAAAAADSAALMPGTGMDVNADVAFNPASATAAPANPEGDWP